MRGVGKEKLRTRESACAHVSSGRWRNHKERFDEVNSLSFICRKTKKIEMRDADGMKFPEEVRKNKSTEKDESTTTSRREADVYHFTKVTNVAQLFSLIFIIFLPCCLSKLRNLF